MSKSTAILKAKKSNVKVIPNWLLEPIDADALVGIGFERTKKSPVKHELLSRVSEARITNASGEAEVLYYQPLDVVAYKNGDTWYLSLDSDMDHIWQGRLKNMGDLVQVLIGLSK